MESRGRRVERLAPPHIYAEGCSEVFWLCNYKVQQFVFEWYRRSGDSVFGSLCQHAGGGVRIAANYGELILECLCRVLCCAQEGGSIIALLYYYCFAPEPGDRRREEWEAGKTLRSMYCGRRGDQETLK